MDPSLRRRMLAYYNERATEYEEAYTAGTGTASIADGSVFVREIAALEAVVDRFGQGDFIDLACGTGYWLTHYASRCSRITLFDQAEHMLAEAQHKVHALGIAGRCSLVRGNLFDHAFDRGAWDCALVGFLISHLTLAEEAVLFDRLKQILRRAGSFLVLDSAWTQLRARYNHKAGRHQRRLNDGTVFEIYKRYLSADDIHGWRRDYGVTLRIEYFGEALCAVSGSIETPAADITELPAR